MADTTNIETLQAQLERQQTEAGRMQALQQVLEAFAPGTLQSPVAYRVLLHRVKTLLEDALASAPPPEGPPQAEAPPPQAAPPTPPPDGETEVS